jgi:Putative redox-active protein (C_GCAxxG_C_C)
MASAWRSASSKAAAAASRAMIATMALGGDAFADDVNAFNRVMNLGHDLARWFEAQFGSTQCRTLTGCDFATSEGVHAYIEHDGTSECARMARLVAERVADIVTAAADVPPDRSRGGLSNRAKSANLVARLRAGSCSRARRPRR